MATLMRNMFRTVSLPPDTPKPPMTPSGSGGLTNSPSFNDFSLHVAQDAETEYGSSAEVSRRNAMGRRWSCDSRFSHEALESVSRETESKLWHGRPPAGWSTHGKSSAMPIPHSKLAYHNHLPPPSPHSAPVTPQKPTATDEATTPVRRKFREGKIDGMDYYEFCELIRSSSL